MGLVCSPSSLGGSEEAEGLSEVVRFFTLVKITTRVQTPRGSLLCQRAYLTYKPNMGPRRKPRAHGPKKKATVSREPITDQTSLTRIYYSTRAAQLSGTPTISTKILFYQYEDPSRSHPRL